LRKNVNYNDNAMNFILLIIGVISFIFGSYYGYKKYNVWRQRKKEQKKRVLLCLKYNLLLDNNTKENIRHGMHIVIQQDKGKKLTFEELLDHMSDVDIKTLEVYLNTQIQREKRIIQ